MASGIGSPNRLKSDVEAAFGAGDDGMEMGCAAGGELEIEIQLAGAVAQWDESLLGRDGFEKFEGAALRRVY